MEQQKKITIGILAHVDAGKTTLSEAFLYLSGRIRNLGRVDHQNAYLDTFALERARGITIFSKQAEFTWKDLSLTLLDTPGHVDFAAEMERTLQVLDYAVLVISGPDGIQGHTETLWHLLERYEVPVFLFVNKMDQPGTEKKVLLQELTRRLDGNCIDFGEESESLEESLAMCEEAVMNCYLEKGCVDREDIIRMIWQRKVFPCFFGSALKLEGVENLLDALQLYTRMPIWGKEFGAIVYKISRDEQGKRLTHLKVTGGKLKVKSLLSNRRKDTGEQKETGVWEEKIDQIRVYSGNKYELQNEVSAGTVCVVTGLTQTWAGQRLGVQEEGIHPLLTPLLTYQILFPEGCDLHQMLRNLRQLEEEEPELHIVWNESLQEIHVQVMGAVQIEILQSLIRERYHVEAGFGTGKIVYRETIAEPVEGAGHFEPLRHYAEVHLLLEPGEPGSGIQIESACSVDLLSLNWQRLIFTHILEKEHLGALTGSPVTDLRITLLAGRAHIKHTEGGDFRQATYRALRQGFCKARGILLEPWYQFRLELPQECIGRAMADIQKMSGSFEQPQIQGDYAVLCGRAPVSEMRDYQIEISAYSRGRGRFSCSFLDYEPCHNTEEVLQEIAYDPDRDTDNPADSVFCAHGAGFVVDWREADSYMHIQTLGQENRKEGWFETYEDLSEEEETYSGEGRRNTGMASKGIDYKDRFHDEDELKEIFARTFRGGKEETRNTWKRREGELTRQKQRKQEETAEASRKTLIPKKYAARSEEYLLIDGYNIIYAWEDLHALMEKDLGAARTKLMDILSNYQGFKGCQLILVFDAYRVEGHPGEIYKYHNIYVVFTKEAETADQYIEKTVHAIAGKYHVTVATSDRLEQIIISGEGASRLSAADLREEIQQINRQIREVSRQRWEPSKTYLFDQLDENMAKYFEDIRLGHKKVEKT